MFSSERFADVDLLGAGGPVTRFDAYVSWSLKSSGMPYAAMQQLATSPEFVHSLKSAYFLSMFLRGGRKLFRLAPALAVRLAQTKLSKVPCEMLKLPFEAMYVQFPDEPVLIRLPNTTNVGIPAEATDGTGFVYDPDVNRTYACDGVYCVMIGNRLDLMLAGGHPNQRGGDDQIVYATLILEEGLDIDQVLERTFQTTLGQIAELGEDPFGSTLVHPVLKAAAALLFNTLLYISSPDADVGMPTKGESTRKLEAHPKKDEAWRARMRRLSEKEPIVIDVGKHIAYDAGLEAAARADAGDKKYELSVRFRVRGHWKQQPYGPGRSQRKTKWIQPFWKGPELAQVINRNYVVQDTKDKSKP